jgi:tRNA 2-selenouridine synthase SelU
MPKTTKTVKPKTDRPKSRKPANGDIQTTIISISEAEIARRAFEVYCRRGGQHGRDVDDWLQAERELRSELVPSAH